MIRAFRVGRRLARPTRLGTLSREWPACGGFGQGACGAPSLLHTRCAAPQTTTSTTREQLPAALGTDGSRTQWPKCGRSKSGRRCCGCVALLQSQAPERKRVRLRM